MRYVGRITDWYDDRGYGFVTPDLGGERTFVHVSAFECNATRPDRGMRISYKLGRDKRNRSYATCVCGVDYHPKHYDPRTGSCGTIVGALVLGAIAFGAYHRIVPPFVATAYLSMSALAIWLYGKDKFAAITNRWRTPEDTLHFVGLLGGWPGALFAQAVFHHKTQLSGYKSNSVNCLCGW
ncbi:MAG: cold shock and DUF1294 domain-containing protein, partial [Planctomycetota bacterium]